MLVSDLMHVHASTHIMSGLVISLLEAARAVMLATRTWCTLDHAHSLEHCTWHFKLADAAATCTTQTNTLQTLGVQGQVCEIRYRVSKKCCCAANRSESP